MNSDCLGNPRHTNFNVIRCEGVIILFPFSDDVSFVLHPWVLRCPRDFNIP